jgi:hypothetical protein
MRFQRNETRVFLFDVGGVQETNLLPHCPSNASRSTGRRDLVCLSELLPQEDSPEARLDSSRKLLIAKLVIQDEIFVH